MKNLLDPKGQFTFTELERAHCQKFNKKVSKKYLVERLSGMRKILKEVRKDHLSESSLVEGLALVLRLMQAENISFAESFPKYYYFVCRFCGGAACTCSRLKVKPSPKTREELSLFAFSEDFTFSAFQASDWVVYPNGRSREEKLERALHIGEEVFEVSEILGLKSRDKKIMELCDLFERLVSLGSTFHFSLGEPIASFYNQ